MKESENASSCSGPNGEVGEMVGVADAELEKVRRKLKEYWLRAVLEEAV